MEKIPLSNMYKRLEKQKITEKRDEGVQLIHLLRKI